MAAPTALRRLPAASLFENSQIPEPGVYAAGMEAKRNGPHAFLPDQQDVGERLSRGEAWGATRSEAGRSPLGA